MTDRELMFEALSWLHSLDVWGEARDTRAALQARLERPESGRLSMQAPAAYMPLTTLRGVKLFVVCKERSPEFWRPLFPAPPFRRPLTDEQIDLIWQGVERSDMYDCVIPLARAIERAHGIEAAA